MTQDELGEHERKGQILIKSMGFQEYIEEMEKAIAFFEKLVKESEKPKGKSEWAD